jgi:hypothetical protein
MEGDLYHIGYNLRSSIAETFSDDKLIIFLRGYFDKTGSISKKNILKNDLECNFICDEILYERFSKLSYTFTYKLNNKKYNIILVNYDALDFLNDIYKNADARYRDNKKYNIYISLLTHGVLNHQFIKVDENSVLPYKKSYEIGYNITLINLVEKLGKYIFIYDSGIKVIPEFGFYCKIIAKDELIKTGYIVIINEIKNTENETLKITLQKIDDTLPEFKLPFTCCQLLFDKIF